MLWILFNSHINVKKHVVLFPFYRWWHWYTYVKWYSCTARKRNDLLIYMPRIMFRGNWHILTCLSLLSVGKDFVYRVDFFIGDNYFMIDTKCMKFYLLYLMIAMWLQWTFSLRKIGVWWLSLLDYSFLLYNKNMESDMVNNGNLRFLNWAEFNASLIQSINSLAL